MFTEKFLINERCPPINKIKINASNKALRGNVRYRYICLFYEAQYRYIVYCAVNLWFLFFVHCEILDMSSYLCRYYVCMLEMF
jgi:hypothetical protein